MEDKYTEEIIRLKELLRMTFSNVGDVEDELGFVKIMVYIILIIQSIWLGAALILLLRWLR